MIGRGAVGRPWIFKEIKEDIEYLSKELIATVVLEHFEQMINFYGEYGVILFRKHLHTYSKYGYSGASAFRDKINRVTDINEAREIIENFFKS
jgi:tRNA-dihydrouridine synthase B